MGILTKLFSRVLGENSMPEIQSQCDSNEVLQDEYQAVLKKIDKDLEGWIKKASEYSYSNYADARKQAKVAMVYGYTFPTEMHLLTKIHFPFDLPHTMLVSVPEHYSKPDIIEEYSVIMRATYELALKEQRSKEELMSNIQLIRNVAIKQFSLKTALSDNQIKGMLMVIAKEGVWCKRSDVFLEKQRSGYLTAKMIVFETFEFAKDPKWLREETIRLFFPDFVNKLELLENVFKPKMLVFEMEILCFRTEQTQKTIAKLLANLEQSYTERQLHHFWLTCNKLLDEIDIFFDKQAEILETIQLYKKHPDKQTIKLISDYIYTPPKFKRVKHEVIELKNELQDFVRLVKKANSDVDFTSIFFRIKEEESTHASFSQILDYVSDKKETMEKRGLVLSDMLIVNGHPSKDILIEPVIKKVAISERMDRNVEESPDDMTVEEAKLIVASMARRASQETPRSDVLLYDEAVAIVSHTRKASISYVQRRLKIGYNRAARIIEEMEEAGVVTAMQSNGSREVLVPPPLGFEVDK